MLSPRRYSLMVFASPDESRNACALNAGMALPAARAGLPWLHAGEHGTALGRGPCIVLHRLQVPVPSSLHRPKAELVVSQPLPYNPPKGTTVPARPGQAGLWRAHSSASSPRLSSRSAPRVRRRAPGSSHCHSGRSGHQAGTDRLFRRVPRLHRHHRRARERELQRCQVRPRRGTSDRSHSALAGGLDSRNGRADWFLPAARPVSCRSEPGRQFDRRDGSPAAFVTITRAGRSKRIEDYFGAPDGLKQLERQIDEAARTKRWILLDAPTLEQLVRDGWSPAPEERAELFRRAIEDDEPAVVKGLIDLGADPNGSYFGTNTPPLMMVRSAAVTRVLLAAGANPNADQRQWRHSAGLVGVSWRPTSASSCSAPARVSMDRRTATAGRRSGARPVPAIRIWSQRFSALARIRPPALQESPRSNAPVMHAKSPAGAGRRCWRNSRPTCRISIARSSCWSRHWPSGRAGRVPAASPERKTIRTWPRDAHRGRRDRKFPRSSARPAASKRHNDDGVLGG